MANYTAISTDAKHFVVKEEENTFGNLEYKSWYSLKANMQISGDYATYQFVPKGFWGTTIELKKGEQVLLHFKMSWNGDIIILSNINDVETGYKLKYTGFLKPSYVLENKEGNKLLEVKPSFKWTKFTCDHVITSTPEFEAIPYSKLLLLTALHCTNYYITMGSDVSAAVI